MARRHITNNFAILTIANKAVKAFEIYDKIVL